MFRKMLLASAVSFVAVAGALYVGVGIARAADDSPRFYFRNSAGLLPMTVAAAPEDQDGEEVEEPEIPVEPEPEPEPEPDPVNGLVIITRLELQDSNGNGFGDRGERLYIRGTVRNATAAPISDIWLNYTMAVGSAHKAGSNRTDLEAGQTFNMSMGPLYLTAGMLADLASGIEFEAFVSLTAAGGETWSPEENKIAVPVVPFGVQ